MTSFQTLHILNKAPGHCRHSLCLSAIGPADGLLLIENGVLALPQSLETKVPCFALAPDVIARGLASAESEATMVSFDDMVALVSAAGNVISW